MAQIREFSSQVPSENPLKGIIVKIDGLVFECKGRLSVLQLSKLASKAITDGMAEAAEAASIYQTFALAFGSEYPRFEAHVEEHETPDETILGVLQYINEQVQANIERIVARPTRPSSSSTPGRAGRAAQPARRVSLSKQTVEVGDVAAAKPARTPKARTPRKTATGTSRRTA